MEEALKSLEPEIQAFEEQLPVLREKFPIGTYVLFAGACLLGAFDSYSEALKMGYEKVGMEPFLVKQVSREGEDVQYVY